MISATINVRFYSILNTRIFIDPYHGCKKEYLQKYITVYKTVFLKSSKDKYHVAKGILSSKKKKRLPLSMHSKLLKNLKIVFVWKWTK